MNHFTRFYVIALGFVTFAMPVTPACLAQDLTSATTQRTTNLPANEQKSALSLPRLGLKNGKFMLVVDPDGMLPAGGLSGYGLYADDTRYLSDLTYTINGLFPTLLQSSVDEGFAGRFIYGNRAIGELKEQSILCDRQLVLRDGLVENITLRNYSMEKQTVKFGAHIFSNFEDMFEVRGQKRALRGHMLPPQLTYEGDRLIGERLSYEGRDNNVMSIDVSVHGQPVSRMSEDSFDVELELAPGASKSFEVRLQPVFNGKYLSEGERAAESYGAEIALARQEFDRWRAGCASIHTDNETVNRIIERSWRDLYMLRQPTPKGYCMGAGIPWYAAAFGRDQLVVGLQTLPFNHQLSQEILSVLANYQGTKDDPATEESPGKIMHELRVGEMARCHEIAFVPYFGTVDATPLWVMLLSEYTDWTGDTKFLETMWPHLEAALNYFDAEVKAGGGYLRYGLRNCVALNSQGWKDSGDSISHKDGSRAAMPVALCEVQGYLYESWKCAARLARRLGKESIASSLDEKAAQLRMRFQKDFWMPDQKFVALALDGANKQCAVISSNPGHLLLTEILSSQQKESVATRLSVKDMYCGWGIRTLSSGERKYNPMSYHNGSVWPHDTAYCLAGIQKTGNEKFVKEVVSGLFEVASDKSDLRLPELFCGFSREEFNKPVDYPVACSPQAWAAGAVLQMMSSVMGLTLDANHQLKVQQNMLPEGMGNVSVGGILVDGKRKNMRFAVVSPGSVAVDIQDASP